MEDPELRYKPEANRIAKLNLEAPRQALDVKKISLNKVFESILYNTLISPTPL